jgi:hypothetical protein
VATAGSSSSCSISPSRQACVAAAAAALALAGKHVWQQQQQQWKMGLMRHRVMMRRGLVAVIMTEALAAHTFRPITVVCRCDWPHRAHRAPWCWPNRTHRTRRCVGSTACSAEGATGICTARHTYE